MSISRLLSCFVLYSGQKIIRRAMKKNFKWPNESAVLEKLQEEIKEFEAALKNGDKKNQKEELGDMLFTVVCLATQMNLSAGGVLDAANKKFKKRFKAMERLIRADKKTWRNCRRASLRPIGKKLRDISPKTKH